MKKLFGGKSKNRANGSSRDLSAEETASQATVPTPIHAKLATTTPPATGVKGATLTKPSPAQKAQQQLELEQQKAQLAIQQQQQQLLAQQQAQQQQQVRRPSPPQDPFPTGEHLQTMTPSDGKFPTYRSQGPAPHIIPVSRSSSYSSIPPPPSIPAAQGQRPASPATSIGMRHNAQRPGATTAVVLNNLAALGPAQPKKPQQAPVVLNHLKSLEPPRPGAEYPGSRYTDYSDRQSVSDHNQSQPALPPPRKNPKEGSGCPRTKSRTCYHARTFLDRILLQQRRYPVMARAAGHAQHPSHPGVFGQPGQGVEEPPNDLTRRIGEPDPPSPPHHTHSHHFPHHFASHPQNSPQTTDARDPRRLPNTTPAPAQPVMTFTPRNITETIGYLTATASEDFALVYDVCDRASANEANAKEAVRALRREFKYGEPPAQLSAARLWAIMLHNSSPIFVVQSRSRKFMDTIEDILTSSRTNPVVKERLLDVVGAAAYATRHHSKQDGFQALWRKVKPHDKPDEGVPFDTEDAMFNPAPSSRLSQYEVPYSALLNRVLDSSSSRPPLPR
ncbi:hypothetical protein FA13DRAFT_1804322 [Coprinellus micaceus]|uniref:VHS domain-containing protein n=1 Tax=Coprinellus micaceus TaxID=71717 RepID=A0A4Y7S8S3_COPMI|nr:hypothetical protein FA13DRAFT_1804322 [Coprinellus micaceus]